MSHISGEYPFSPFRQAEEYARALTDELQLSWGLGHVFLVLPNITSGEWEQRYSRNLWHRVIFKDEFDHHKLLAKLTSPEMPGIEILQNEWERILLEVESGFKREEGPPVVLNY